MPELWTSGISKKMSKLIRPTKVLTEGQIVEKANKDFRTVKSLWQLLQNDVAISVVFEHSSTV